MIHSPLTHNRPVQPTFILGSRVTDPTIDFTSTNDDRYRLNANIFQEDAELLKRISANRGTIQLVTANLINSFCKVLKSNGINSRLESDKFHHQLAAWSGLYPDCGFTNRDLSSSLGGFVTADSLDEVLSVLPEGIAQRIRDCVQRETLSRTSRDVAGRDDSGPAESVRKSSARVKKIAADSGGVGQAGCEPTRPSSRRKSTSKTKGSSNEGTFGYP